MIPNPIKSLIPIGISSIFCDKEILINEYLRLINNTVKNISMYDAFCIINLTPAYCPDEVRFVADIIVAIRGVIPVAAITPKEKDTAK